MIDPFNLIKRFDELSDDCVVPPKVAAIVLGIPDRTLRYKPPIPRVQITERKNGYRVGDLRALVRGLQPAT